MFDRGLDFEQLPYCMENNVAVLAYSPLMLGLLTGKVDTDRKYATGDWRQTHPRFAKDNIRRVLAMLEKFKPIADAHNVTLAQLAIAWTFHQPGMTHVLCGARTIEQSKENAAAGRVELTAEELQTIDEAIAESGVQ